jgi:hypothetical protein
MNGDNSNAESEADKPALTLIDVQRGWKYVTVSLKSGEERKIQIVAISWERLGAIHFEHKPETVEREILEASLPHRLDDLDDTQAAFAWLEWVDIESRNLVTRVAREFAYGFQTEKKRNEAIRQISKLLSARNATPPSSASATDSAKPSPGASPSSPSSSIASASEKPTTV